MTTEIELKYSILATNDLPSYDIHALISDAFITKGLQVEHNELFLSNAYYDTSSLALRKQKIALRTRGTKPLGKPLTFEQTIKTSGKIIAGLHQRPEYNVDIDTATPNLALFPETIWQANTDIEKLQGEILELFSTNFTRYTWLITLEHAQVEVAFDAGEIVCEGNPNKPSIYEIELELVAGDATALFDLTKLLFSHLKLRPGQLTKAARGYALYNEVMQDQVENKSTSKKITSTKAKFSGRIDACFDTYFTQCLEDNVTFSACIEYNLKHLQLAVDSYVISKLANKNKLGLVCHYLMLLSKILEHFNYMPTSSEADIYKDLKSIINFIQAHDHIGLTHTENEQAILDLLHSERFNNIQLNLLDAILKKY